MKKRCKKSAHDWQPMRGGKRERCVNCGDVYPCRTACEHVDCILDTGRELPDYVSVAVRSES